MPIPAESPRPDPNRIVPFRQSFCVVHSLLISHCSGASTRPRDDYLDTPSGFTRTTEIHVYRADDAHTRFWWAILKHTKFSRCPIDRRRV